MWVFDLKASASKQYRLTVVLALSSALWCATPCNWTSLFSRWAASTLRLYSWLGSFNSGSVYFQWKSGSLCRCLKCFWVSQIVLGSRSCPKANLEGLEIIVNCMPNDNFVEGKISKVRWWTSAKSVPGHLEVIANCCFVTGQNVCDFSAMLYLEQRRGRTKAS